MADIDATRVGTEAIPPEARYGVALSLRLSLIKVKDSPVGDRGLLLSFALVGSLSVALFCVEVFFDSRLPIGRATAQDATFSLPDAAGAF